MKYIYTIMVMAFVSMAIISINPQKGHSNSSGAPAGNTGAGETTCAQAGCHGGTAGTVANAITSDVPAGGYISGTTYNITVTSAETGRPRFGFQCRTSAGTLIASSTTQLVGGGAYVTHRLASTAGTDSKSWTFTWTAPAAGTGDVTFNAAVMAANGNGSSDPGDIVRTSSLVISEAASNSVKSFDAAGMSIYPVPFTNELTIAKGTQSFEQADVKVFTLDGKMVLNTVMTGDNYTLNTENLAKGIYIVNVNAGSTTIMQKVAKF